jgi:DNA topoisomerase-1
MEADLDRIAQGQADRLTVMQGFYGPFKEKVDQAMSAAALERQPAARETTTKGRRYAKGKKRGKSGPWGRKGAGSKTAQALPASDKAGQPCPQCQTGTLAVKKGKFGAFLGCSRFSEGCRFTEKI